MFAPAGQHVGRNRCSTSILRRRCNIIKYYCFKKSYTLYPGSLLNNTNLLSFFYQFNPNLMKKYVSLLRGINVGGHKKVPMADLRKLLEKHGFRNVKTLLASGNVVYESDPEKADRLSALLEDHFGFAIPVLTFLFETIEKILDSDPFRTLEIKEKTKLYVTFTRRKPSLYMNIPYVAEDGSFGITGVIDTAIFSFVDLEKTGTLDAMAFLEKEFGKDLTTRNYNTVMKIAKL